MSYEDYGLRRLPQFLKGAWGTLWCTVHAGLVQRLEDAARDAVLCHYAATAPDDALPVIAHDTNLPHLVESESLGALRDRVADPWAWHLDVGKEAGVDALLATVGFDPLETYVVDRSLGESWCHESGWWSSWYVVTRNPTGWDIRATSYNAAAAESWDGIGECWDVTAHPSVFTQLHELLWRYKWAHSVPVGVVMLFGSGEPWDHGIWTATSWDDLAAVDYDTAGDGSTSIRTLRTAALYDNDIRILNGSDTRAEVTWDQAAQEGQRWSPKIRPTVG